MKKIIVLCLIAFSMRAQQTETVTSVKSETLSGNGSISSATTVITTTTVPGNLPAATSITPALPNGMLSLKRTHWQIKFLWKNRVNDNLESQAENPLKSVTIANTGDTLLKVRLRPNDTLIIPDLQGKNQVLKLVNSRRQSVIIRLKPKGALKISVDTLSKDPMQIKAENKGQTRAYFKIRKKAVLTIIRASEKKTGVVKPGESSTLIFRGKDDTLLVVNNKPGTKLTYTGDEGSVKLDSDGLNMQSANGINVRVIPKAKKSSEPPLFDFMGRVFNDAKGFDPQQPNGLVQTEFAINLNIASKPLFKLGSWKVFCVRNVMFPCFNLLRTKRDTNFRYAPVHYAYDSVNRRVIDSTVNIHTLNLVRYAAWNITSRVNLLTIQNKDKSISFYLDAYGAFYATGLSYDTILMKRYGIKSADAKFMVYSAGGGLSSKLRLGAANSKFSVEASVTGFGLKLLSDPVHQNYGRFYQPDYDKRNDDLKNLNLAPKNVSYFRGLTTYGIQVRYSSQANKDNFLGSGIFVRVNYTTNPLIQANNTISYGNSFIQIQAGVSVDIKTLLTSAGLAEPK